MSGQRSNRKQQVHQNHEKTVRTLYIAPIMPYMRVSIREYFRQFGPVQSVRVHSKGVDFHYGFVQFKRAESARKALLAPKHFINNRTVKVKEASQQRGYGFKMDTDILNNNNVPMLSKNPLPATINQEQSTILKVLDDDCLKEIFKHLHLKDLCSVAQVCMRFNQNAHDHFKVNYAKLNIIEMCTEDDIKNNAVISLSLVEEGLLRNFGQCITSLVLVHSAFDEDDCDEMLNLVSKYCAGTMRILVLYGFEINEPSSLRPLFAKLTTLVMYDFVGTNRLQNLFAQCQELKCLRIGNCLINNGNWIKQKFSSLEEFELDSVYDLSNGALEQIFRKNSNLRKLMIAHVELPSSILRIICKQLKNLEQLYFNGNFDDSEETDEEISKNVLRLSELKSLNCLKFNWEYSESQSGMKGLVDRLLKQNATLETFGMLGGTIDKELVVKLSKLSKVTKLHLINTKMHHLTLMDLAKQMPNLVEIRVQDVKGIDITEIQRMLPLAANLQTLDIISFDVNIKLNTETYYTMLNVIKNRGNNTKLSLNIFCNRSQITVPKSLIQRNRYWWDIKEVCMNLDINSDPNSETENVFVELGGLWFDSDDDSDNDSDSDIDMNIDDDENIGDEQEQGEVAEDAMEQHMDDALRAMVHFIISLGHRF